MLENFNPNNPGREDALYGLPHNFEQAAIIVLPIPWDVTVSYGYGTHNAPQRVLEASAQVDLFDFDNPEGWKQGIFMLEPSSELSATNKELRAKAKEIIRFQEQGGQLTNNALLGENLRKVNEQCADMVKWVAEQCTNLMNRNKFVALLGGDHSTPLGYIHALANKYDSFGILQIDAHADLRNAYEGFEYSHASIMYNALKLEQVEKLVQVGVRDLCQEEMNLIDESEGRIISFFDPYIKEQMFGGRCWADCCEKIIKELPQNVYISFDIDGLDPKLCPNTGTPVPGGLEFEMASYLLAALVESGRTIIGMDLVEVGDNEWDANVGARMLFKMCNLIGLAK